MSSEAPRTVAPDRYWEQRLREQPGLAGVGVTALGPGFNRWAYRVRGANFDRAVRRLLDRRPPTRVLDVGSGTGFYLERWRALGAAEVVGTDLTATAIDDLRARFRDVRLERLDIGSPDAISSSGLEPGSFDYVSAMDVLFHILDEAAYQRAFVNIAELLTPGGFIVFSEDLIPARRARARQIKVTRSRRQTRRAWREAGLTLVSRDPFLRLMNFPSAGTPRSRRRYARMHRLAAGRPRLGWLFGAALYPAERLLTRYSPKAPSTKLVVCAKG